jgi:hypothetical protein
MSASKSRGPQRKPTDNITDVNNANTTTPGTDMQPEDAGTSESGNTGRGTAAEGAMKQTSKTESENARKDKRR